MKIRLVLRIFILAGLLLLTVSDTQAQAPGPGQGPTQPELTGAPSALGSLIGFQGQLTLSGTPMHGTCNFIFSLWNAASGPSQIGSNQPRNNVELTNGMFMVADLDFGANAFDGNPRWLEIAVQCPGDSAFTTLTPRSPIRPAPYALYSGNSDKLDGSDASAFLNVSGGRMTGPIDFLPSAAYHDFAIGVEGAGSYPGWFYIKDLNDSGQPLRFQVKGDTGDVIVAKNLGVGIDPPTQRLDVNGIARFLVGSGSVSISSPGAWPGLIALSPSGHRRDIVFGDNALQLTTSSTSSAPANESGIWIGENGYVGLGTTSPEQRLHVNGLAKFQLGLGNVSMSTPGGWPGLIAYSPIGHRRDIVFRDDALQLTVSSTSSAPFNESGLWIAENGYVGVGTTGPASRLDVAGTTRTQILQITGGSDLAEPFDVVGDGNVAPGMVVAIDPLHPGQLRIADQPYDPTVAGCVSGANGIQPGLTMHQQGTQAEGDFPVALSGRVYCLADAAYGSIKPGDLLTTSANPGYAMRAADRDLAFGAIIGKAMSSLASGQGFVLVLVTLQ